jgi:hypothetical protein
MHAVISVGMSLTRTYVWVSHKNSVTAECIQTDFNGYRMGTLTNGRACALARIRIVHGSVGEAFACGENKREGRRA